MVNLNRSLQIVLILFLYYKYDLKYSDTFSENTVLKSTSSPSHHDVRAQPLVEEIAFNQTISQPTTLPYSMYSPLLNKNDILYRFNISTSPIIIEEYKLVTLSLDKTGSTVSCLILLYCIHHMIWHDFSDCSLIYTTICV